MSSRIKDMHGKRFGKLTVIEIDDEKTNNSKGKVAHWICKCDCGETKIVRGDLLRSGKITSCGCSNIEDLTGQRFGRLIVLQYHGNTGSKRKIHNWLCKCDCGNTVVRSTHALKDSFNSGCDICRYIKHDLTGKKFGKLTVAKISGRNNRGQYLWLCECECGNTTQVTTTLLLDGKATSCGCSKKERFIQMNTTHNLSKTRIYKIYIGMKNRCLNINAKAYRNYGGRGITICPEWLGENGFENFYNWAMANGYHDDLSIDRIDVNGNYEPLNCRWVDYKTQARNTRKTIYIEIDGIRKSIFDWCEMVGINYKRAYQRYTNGNEPFDDNELNKIKNIIREDNICQIVKEHVDCVPASSYQTP